MADEKQSQKRAGDAEASLTGRRAGATSGPATGKDDEAKKPTEADTTKARAEASAPTAPAENKNPTAQPTGAEVADATRQPNEMPGVRTASQRPAAAPGSAEDVYARVEGLLEGGTQRREAFDAVASALGKSPNTIQATYYRARREVGGGGRRSRAGSAVSARESAEDLAIALADLVEASQRVQRLAGAVMQDSDQLRRKIRALAD